jgi:hypothetical protein
MKFDGYNKKHDIPEPLIFTKEEEEKINDMKKYIEKIVFESEENNMAFTDWLFKIYNP